MTKNAIVLSIHSQYATLIFNGHKKVELRKQKPKYLKQGSLVLVYVTNPVRALWGAFSVKSIIRKPIDELWVTVKDLACLSKDEYYDYYNKSSYGVAIFIENVWCLNTPIQLSQLTDFQAPQSFRYVTDIELDNLISNQIYCDKSGITKAFSGRKGSVCVDLRPVH